MAAVVIVMISPFYYYDTIFSMYGDDDDDDEQALDSNVQTIRANEIVSGQCPDLVSVCFFSHSFIHSVLKI